MADKDLINVSPATLSDRDLHGLAVKCGGNAKQWLRQFGALLPEIFKRGIYKKHGCSSIHYYAKIFGGMNEATVDKILRLRRRLEGKPRLLGLFESGKEGWSKLGRVAGIATEENDAELAAKVEDLPSRALEIFVKNHEIGKPIGFPEPKMTAISPGGELEAYTNKAFCISKQTERKLKILRQRLEKEQKQALSWNEVFALWLYKTEVKTVIRVCPACAQRKGIESKNRAIPADVQRLVRARSGGVCEANCNEPACVFHHKKRWALKNDHDPRHIVHLCLAHHDLVHFGLIENEDDSPGKWQVGQGKQRIVDEKFQSFKKF